MKTVSGLRLKTYFQGSTLLACAVYFALAAIQFAASVAAGRATLGGLRVSVRLEPDNAQYRDELGQFYSLVQQLPESIAEYQRATQLNPGHARYWLDLAAADGAFGDALGQKGALARAAEVDPKNPRVLWESGNVHLASGDIQSALKELRAVISAEPPLTGEVIQQLWNARPDVNLLMQYALPANSAVYSRFLDFLVSKNDGSAAALVWQRILQLGGPIPLNEVSDYIRYLISHEEPGEAGKVWSEAMPLCGLAAYRPSAENLVVNGDFGLNPLNGGFDWTFEKRPDVSLQMDPNHPHMGSSSLLIAYDGRGIEDSGVHQMIAVEPVTAYRFSAFFKTQDLQGAGQLQYVLQDFYSGQPLLESENLKESSDWNSVSGSFETGRDTRLLLLRIRHAPAEAAIRGQLWIASVRLTGLGRQ